MYSRENRKSIQAIVELKNMFLLPHVGSATVETRVAMGMLALDNIDSVLAGRPAPTIIPE